MMVPMPSGLSTKEAQTHDETLFQSLSADPEGVSTFVRVSRTLEFNFTDPRPCKQACLLPFSLHSSSTVFTIYNVIPRSKWEIITSDLSRCSPRSHNKPRLSLHRFPSHLLPHHLTPRFIHWFRTSEWTPTGLIGLGCRLSAALFATLVQEWVRSYMQVFRRCGHPLKRARFRPKKFSGVVMEETAERKDRGVRAI
jgi:hypothetical protein